MRGHILAHESSDFPRLRDSAHGNSAPQPDPNGMDVTRLLLVVIAAAIGGAINSIAGGGTLITFPALVGLGVPAIVANATSTVALWPGALGSMYGYRQELAGARAWAIRFAVPSLVGGLVGAL